MRVACALCSLVLWVSAARAEVELKNDGFTSGASAGFQLGFVANEAAASRFVAPDAGRQVTRIQLLYGGATTTRSVTIKVWDDTAGATDPGTELYTGDFTLTGSNDAMQEINLSADNVTVPQQFRVGIVFHDDGAPSVAQDKDQTIAVDKNYLLANGTTWIQSKTAGLTGDWIIRAFVSGTDPNGGDAGVTPTSCNSNTDCPTGSFCDTAAHACTFECRTNADCGDGTCNSLGQCVGGSGGGCCRTDRGNASAILFGIGIGAALLLRRRRR